MTDPEAPVTADRYDLAERAAHLSDGLDAPSPIEADEADVAEQKVDVPDAGEDDYPA